VTAPLALYNEHEPGSFPLADQPAGRVVRLRGYGNAIVSEVAAGWIRTSVEAFGLTRSEGRWRDDA
jgi:hypothetical protein